MSSVNKYLQEYEKYKHINLQLDGLYEKKSRPGEKVKIIFIDEVYETALVRNLRTENTQNKTLHWCRKNLSLVEE